MPYKDPEKQKEYKRNYSPGWYQKNKEKHKQQVKVNKKSLNVWFFTEFKPSLKCIRCGYNKCSAAIEFHHRNPKEKEHTMSYYIKWSKKRILEEVSKCDILCANCHREVHMELRLLPNGEGN